MDLKIPVIALSQLNRNMIDSNSGKAREPNLSDLRESGSLEQDANSVLFLHKFGKESDNFENVFMTLYIAKNRNGSTGKVFFNFKPMYLRFREAELVDGKLHEFELDEVGDV